jgi:hypothetical protein
MDAFINPTKETTNYGIKDSKEASKDLPSDYILYVTACNEKVQATGDNSFKALPEHLWRSSTK